MIHIIRVCDGSTAAIVHSLDQVAEYYQHYIGWNTEITWITVWE